MFFLGVMGLMMLHNALPHVHHSHESHGEVASKAKHNHHAHGHAHHHGHQHHNQHSTQHVDDHSSQKAEQSSHEQSADRSDQLTNHHSDEQDNGDDAQGFLLSFLLDNHSHSFHTHEIIQLAKPGNQYLLDKHVPDSVVLDSPQPVLEFENQFLHRFSLFKQAYSDDPFSLDSPLRGPPSIG